MANFNSGMGSSNYGMDKQNNEAASFPPVQNHGYYGDQFQNQMSGPNWQQQQHNMSQSNWQHQQYQVGECNWQHQVSDFNLQHYHPQMYNQGPQTENWQNLSSCQHTDIQQAQHSPLNTRHHHHGNHSGTDVSAPNVFPPTPGYSDSPSNKADAAAFRTPRVTRNPLLTTSYLPALHQASNQASGSVQPRASAVPKEAEHKKPIVTNFVLIADVLLASETGMMAMQDICTAISERYPYYNNSDKWKGGIRHTLSINDCFYMIPRADGKRGSLWAIHQAALEAFKKGDYNRRKANRNAQHWHQANNA